ncbi:MAG: YbaB/EbfC family nucleoid-associated protein [Planctomycetota bacterium]|nr:YbaB/EbfC family nucleoid-associated protein [Planctomycetota bacterium]
MFDNVRMLGAISGLMKNKEKIAEATQRVRATLEAARLTGEAGAGAARAEVTGTMRVLRVELSPALVQGMAADEKTRALASSLVADAVNDAIRKAQERMRAEIDAEAKALGLEGLLGGQLGDMLGGKAP